MLALLLVVLLLPLFDEFDLFGVKLKAQISEVQFEVRERISSLSSDIIDIGVNTQVSPHISLAPAPDSQLPALKAKFQEVLDELRHARNIDRTVNVQTEMLAPSDVNCLFVVRYNTEKELRRIWKERFDQPDDREPTPVYKIFEALRSAELIDSRFSPIVRKVYSVCSPALHGEQISERQVNFVRDIAPNLMTTLLEIR